MHYERINEYFGEPHRQMKEKLRKTNLRVKIFAWSLIVFVVLALGFFGWVIITVVRDMK